MELPAADIVTTPPDLLPLASTQHAAAEMHLVADLTSWLTCKLRENTHRQKHFTPDFLLSHMPIKTA